ncbi:MAG: hypothetical protein KGS72_04545 [Cyanobacteria bacterium REEB67]|nr:hypothetical protein [Cyanobacteria bacterium REEB67]
MLKTLGQGVVLNALIEAGFTASSHDFDFVRLFKNRSSRAGRYDTIDGAEARVIAAEVTCGVNFGNTYELVYSEERPESERLNEFAELPEDLAALVIALTERGGCKFVVTPPYWKGSLCFERIDHFKLGTPHGGPAPSTFQHLATKVNVRVAISTNGYMPRPH